MLLLGIDTATPATTVAVFDGVRVLAEQTTVDARRHAEVLTPAIRAVLERAGVEMRDLTAVAVGNGPGPYTGLRVGVATAGAVADALGVPAYGVCTLDVLAHQAGREHAITAITDARRREVFWACYDAGGHRVAGPNVNRPADVAVRGRAVGPGALLYADVFDVSEAEQVSAGALCSLVAHRLAARQPLEPARPIYLRRPDTAPAQPAKPVLQT